MITSTTLTVLGAGLLNVLALLARWAFLALAFAFGYKYHAEIFAFIAKWFDYLQSVI